MFSLIAAVALLTVSHGSVTNRSTKVAEGSSPIAPPIYFLAEGSSPIASPIYFVAEGSSPIAPPIYFAI
jgi:hypothetical protein